MKSFSDSTFKLGILGGGQLGRMFLQEAANFNIHVSILDPSADAPCRAFAHEFVQGDFMDYDTVLQFGQSMDVLTIEIEHVNVEALQELERQGKQVYPQPHILGIIKDKGLQKEFYRANGIPTSSFKLVEADVDLHNEIRVFPIVQKLRTGGYDGKGVQILRSTDDLGKAFTAPSVLEDFAPFEKEIAVIVARNHSGQIRTFPLVEMEFNDEANLVEFLFSPSHVSDTTEQTAMSVAAQIVEKLQFVGLMAVEMFVMADGGILVNEMAPRAHNSGHHTIEACTTSQYEQWLRAILNLPLGDTRLMSPAVMINLLGEKGYEGPVVYRGMEEVLAMDGTHVHLYGKSVTKPFRKMGHITVTAADLEDAKAKARQAMTTLKVVSA